jgi:hypothetical protein
MLGGPAAQAGNVKAVTRAAIKRTIENKRLKNLHMVVSFVIANMGWLTIAAEDVVIICSPSPTK